MPFESEVAMSTDVDVVVVGAGISGLTAAWELQRAGASVEVVDEASRAGGVIGSRRRDGVLYELGPNSSLDTTPLVNQLLDEVGIRDQRLNASSVADTRYIVRDGRLTALPTAPAAFLTTPAFSLAAKMRLAAEPFIKPLPPDVEESIAGFVRRRLGREFLDYAIDPFVAGIYAGDPERISVPGAFPRLHALEQKYGSLILGQIKGARERRKNPETAKNVAKSFSFREGMQTLTDAIARRLEHVSYDVRVASVARDADGTFTVDGVQRGAPWRRRARAVVLATPAYATAGIVERLAPDASRALGEIAYAPVAIVATAYRRSDVAHPIAGFGVLVPKVEQRRILGSLFSSSMFENRAPEGTVILTTFAGGRRNPDVAALPDGALVETVRADLAALVGAKGEPLWAQVTRWPRAIPQYDLGHRERLARVERAEAAIPGLWFCATYRGGVSVSDCIKNGYATAEKVGAALAARPQAEPVA